MWEKWGVKKKQNGKLLFINISIHNWSLETDILYSYYNMYVQYNLSSVRVGMLRPINSSRHFGDLIACFNVVIKQKKKDILNFSAGKIQSLLLWLLNLINVLVWIAGIHYRIISIWIEALLKAPLGGALYQLPKCRKWYLYYL